MSCEEESYICGYNHYGPFTKTVVTDFIIVYILRNVTINCIERYSADPTGRTWDFLQITFQWQAQGNLEICLISCKASYY